MVVSVIIRTFAVGNTENHGCNIRNYISAITEIALFSLQKYKKVMKGQNKIYTNFGAIAKMARDLGVNRDTVGDALNGTTQSTLACVIRNVAVLYYGGTRI